MADKSEARIPAGMRDILPEQMIKRQYVIDVIQGVFEEFGFDPLQTSAIELAETLLGKYGEDAERLIYRAWYGNDPGGEFALRYDLSVPLSRVAAMHADQLGRPFKRYQIAPVWRADRPQKGRYREFFQCDADIVGSSSAIADAEAVAVTATVLMRLGFNNFTISINDRRLLDGIGQYAGVPLGLQAGLYRSIDKLDKIGLEGVRRELLMVGVPAEPVERIQRIARLVLQGKLGLDEMLGKMLDSGDKGEPALTRDLAETVAPRLQQLASEGLAANIDGGELQAYTSDLVGKLAIDLRGFYGGQAEIIPTPVIDSLLELLQITGPADSVLNELGTKLKGIETAEVGIRCLKDMFRYLAAMGIPEHVYTLNFSMVRGLEYYTGPIFETTITEPKAMPSITGGGRYDKLIGLFGPHDMPAVGTSFGIERIIDAMNDLEMFPPDIRPTTTEALVTIFDAEMVNISLEVVRQLRSAGVNTSVYYDAGDRLGEQIGYASARGIRFVVILGPDEVQDGKAAIRRLGRTKDDSEQREVLIGQIADTIRNW